MTVIGTKVMSKKSFFETDQLLNLFDECNIHRSHAFKLWRHLIYNENFSLESVHEFPRRAIPLLKDYCITSRVVNVTEASDKSTVKLLIELQNGKRIETVIMRYGEVELRSYPEEEKIKKKSLNRIAETEDSDASSIVTSSNARAFKSKKRATVCVSSQVGCAMACSFCATGTMGLLSNLTTGEILEQLWHASRLEQIRNVVFMGMGEPLDNYANVVRSIESMTDPQRFSISPSRVTVSTVGVVPRIYQMCKDLPKVSLALSLHAPTQEIRANIVPTAKAWPIDKLLLAAYSFVHQQNQRYLSTTTSLPLDSQTFHNRKRHLLIEYILIGGNTTHVNSSADVAHQLGKLLAPQSHQTLLNLIPYNSTDTGAAKNYESPTYHATVQFSNIVRSYGITCTVRQEMGGDVGAACGQLVVAASKCEQTDIEDLVTSAITPRRAPPPRVREKQHEVAHEVLATNEFNGFLSISMDHALMMILFFAAVCLFARHLPLSTLLPHQYFHESQ